MSESTSPVGVAFIGCGIWEEDAELVFDLENNASPLSLRAIYGQSRGEAVSLAKFLNGRVDLYSDVDLYSERRGYGLEDLLGRSDIEAVVISLPIPHQPYAIKTALLAGKHVLSAKPVAENVKDLKEFIEWYREEIKGPTWTIAESWRSLKSYQYAAEQIQSLGRIIGFQGRQHGIIPKDWRFTFNRQYCNPAPQAGYLFDGGVHYVAGLRLLLGVEPGHQVASLSAFTNQIQPHLPPADTADVILRTTRGVTGVFQMSRGTSLRADEWTIACSDGWIKVENEKVTISRGKKLEVVTIRTEGGGDLTVLQAWGKCLQTGKALPEQKPEAALADVELIELILESGRRDGATLACSHQNA